MGWRTGHHRSKDIKLMSYFPHSKFHFRRGIFLNPMGTKLYLSLAHDEAVCDEFLGRFDETLAEI